MPFKRAKPGRYGGGLRALSRTSEPHRKLDLLLTGALIEARSAERFAALAPACRRRWTGSTRQLQRSEARHFQLDLRLAMQAAHDSGLNWRERLDVLASREAELATTPDDQFRFHSGPPQRRAPATARAVVLQRVLEIIDTGVGNGGDDRERAVIVQRVAHLRLRTLLADLGADQVSVAVPPQGPIGRAGRRGDSAFFARHIGIGEACLPSGMVMSTLSPVALWLSDRCGWHGEMMFRRSGTAAAAAPPCAAPPGAPPMPDDRGHDPRAVRGPPEPPDKSGPAGRGTNRNRFLWEVTQGKIDLPLAAQVQSAGCARGQGRRAAGQPRSGAHDEKC